MQKKKHIVMMTGDSGIAYGKQNVFFEMLRGFSRHWDCVSVICPSNERGEVIKIHDNVYLYPSGYSKKFHLDVFRHKSFILKKVREIHAAHPVDIIAAHVIPPLFANLKAAMTLGQELSIPYCAEIMHIPGYPKANNLMERIERRSLDYFLKRRGNAIDHIRLINHSDTYEYIVKRLGIPSEKILCIPAFYLDFDLFKVDADTKRDPNRFDFCGRLEPNKGLDLLVEAMKIVTAKKPEAAIDVIGDGSLKDWLEMEIETVGMSKNIIVRGWLPTRDDVAKVYQESTAIVMPSYNEGGPRVTLEAMACGAVCISTRVGIMQDIVEDGKNTLFIDWDPVDIAAKMLWVLDQPQDAAEVAEAGRLTVQQFEYDSALRSYADKYYEIS